MNSVFINKHRLSNNAQGIIHYIQEKGGPICAHPTARMEQTLCNMLVITLTYYNCDSYKVYYMNHFFKRETLDYFYRRYKW